MTSRHDSQPVYCTERGRLCPQCQRRVTECVCGAGRPRASSDGVVRIRRETRGRGGKTVTVIEGIPEHPNELKAICKQLKQRCGVGGAVRRDHTLEIQGDKRTICQQQLDKMGYQVKLSGG